MAKDTSPGGAAVADDEFDYHPPAPVASDDEFDYHAPTAATAAKPAPAPKPKSWLQRGADFVGESLKNTPVDPSAISRGLGAVGDWAQGKSDAAHEEDLRNAAAGKPPSGIAAYTPSAGYDLLARTAKAGSGATSPASLAIGAGAIAAPEIVGPALAVHGGIGTVEGAHRIAHGDVSPETVGSTLNSAAETAGGLGVIGNQFQGGRLQRGPANEMFANRNPVERGTQAYQDIISPNGTRAAQQVEDLETIRRARPYLAEEARRNPVRKMQPNNPTDPNAGRQLGVANYRQNAQAAADRLWTDKIEPLTQSYGKAPVDGAAIAREIRGTINPDSPVDTARSEAVENLAKFYEKTSTVADATRKIRALNEDRAVQAYEKALPDKQAEMLAADPTLDAKVKAANLLRDGVFDSIDKNGSPQEANYLREARKDFGALRQVSENLGKAQVPTPSSTADKVLEAGHTVVRPISRTAPQASRLFSNPNRLAAKSSRLFGASDLQPRVAPPLPAQPWSPTQPPPFIAPPGAPQSPPPVQPQFAIEAPVPNANVVASQGAPTGTRFGPKGLLPGPIHGTPVQPVGAPPIMGFPADEGMWSLPPRARVEPGFEAPPPGTVNPPPGQVLRPGGIGTIEGPNEFAGRTPPELDRPFPKSGVEHGVQRRTMFEKEAAGEKPAPTDEQYREAKNALKTPGTLEPEELKAHRETVKAYDAAKEAQTGKDVEEVRKTGTANDRPQVKYKPSEKAATMSEKPKDLGKEFKTDQLTHEVTRNQGILDNPDATEEEKAAASKFFEEHPDRKLDKTPGGTAEDRIAARRSTAQLTDEIKKQSDIIRDPKSTPEQIEEATNERSELRKTRRATRQEDFDELFGAGHKAIRGVVDKFNEQMTPHVARLQDAAEGLGRIADVGEAPKISTDSNGIKWAEKTVDGKTIKVSVPKRIPDAEVNDYANKMIAEQAKGQSEMHSNLFGKKNSEASVEQVFGQDRPAEEKAAGEFGARREANKNERLRDRAESAQRVFEGQEPEAKPSWLKMGAERASEATKPVQEEFTQEEIRNGEQAALADAEATLQSDRPGRYFDETELGESNTPLARRNEGTRQFGSWRGVGSGREMYPVLRALPDMSATEVVRALRNPKSPAYQKVVRAAIKANQASAARMAKLGLDKE